MTFLYLLARDELPLGRVEKLVAEAEKTGKKQVKYSEHNLAQWACEVADRLDP